MKPQQIVLVWCVLISSPCLAADNQNEAPNQKPTLSWPLDFSPYLQQYLEAIQSYMMNMGSNLWNVGIAQPNQNGSPSGSPSSNNTSGNNSSGSNSPTSNTTHESTTQNTANTTRQQRSKVRGHPAARHSHKDVKNKHSHAKNHHQGDKHNQHERHHEHTQHKLQNMHEK